MKFRAAAGPNYASRLGMGSRLLTLTALMLVLPVSVAFAQVRVRTSWDNNADILTVGYRVAVGTSPRAPNVEIDAGASTSTTLSLPVGATYYVTVRAYTAWGTEGPSSDETVIDLAAAPGAPSDVSASIHGSSAVLGWAPPQTGGAPNGYLLSVGTAPNAANLLNAYPVGNIVGISGTLPPGTYFGRLHATNYVGTGPPSSEIRFDIAPPSRPLGPIDLSAAWAGARALLTWSRPPESWGDDVPSFYVLEAGTTPGASNLGSLSVGNTTSYVADVPAGTHFVRVRGVGAGGASDPSNEIVLQGPDAPGPASGLVAVVSGETATLTWTAPAGRAQATSYVLEAGSAPGLSNLAVVNVGSATTVSAAIPPGLYFVRVRAANAVGSAAPSNEVIVRR